MSTDREQLRHLVDVIEAATRPNRNARDAQEQLRAVRAALDDANAYLRRTTGNDR